jgi:type IV pilus assembly protein PilC
MPVYTYSARTISGELKRDQIDVPNRDDVIAFLRAQKLIPVSVREKPKGLNMTIGGRMKSRDLVIMTRQFATMINAGLPLVQALDILVKQSDNKMLQSSLEGVLHDVESGNTLADALRQHPKIFSHLYVNMVAAGETGGILDTILLRLSVFLEKTEALARKVKGAMIYPGVIGFVAGSAIVILLLFVIPTFQTMFQSFDQQLPLPTRIVIGMSAFLQSYWWALLAGSIGFVWLFRRWLATSNGRLLFDRVLLRVPILGTLARKSAVARFTRTLGTLLSSGVSILDGLEITAKTSGNRVIHDAIMNSRSSIAGGESISEPLRQSGVFPPMVTQMINVGEETGDLDGMLSKVADFYDEEVDVAVESLLKAMEPAMIVILGTVVGGMIVAMYLPIFGIINTIQ